MDKNAANEKLKNFRSLTLGVKLIATFALTYYLLYFGLVSIFGFYNDDLLHYDAGVDSQLYIDNYYLIVGLWFILLSIIVSLFLVMFKKRGGKYAFMVFTVLLVIYQLCTTDMPTWVAYAMEIFLVVIIGPIKFVREKNLIEIAKSKIKKYEKHNSDR